jgi:tRNA-splicing ligase RtcB
MDDIVSKISFGVGRNNQEEVDHELFDDDAWKLHPAKNKKQMAQNQLGTVGSGNHYVDLFIDELERVWIGVHFGSRGLGHTIASHFIEAGGGNGGMHVPPVILHEKSALGEDYLQLMNLAGRYAYAGRDWVCGKVARILKAKIVEEIHNHHNFSWRENHGGTDYWVVRKGATPAFPGQKGFVGGSMGEISVIIEGVQSELSSESLYSTIHGAGRVMSRTQAAGKKRGKKREGGQITERMMEAWLRDAKVELRGGGVDESPHCYKRLPEVLEHHAGTIRVLHTLTPIGVAMAGADVYDPFKD